MMPASEIDGRRCYVAFVAALNEFLPPIVQTWGEMHPRVREAWIAAAQAAREGS
jgi:hypothetical protein